jgi:hypothetical protein
MVEVFKTNVQEKDESVAVIETLQKKFPAFEINFDLEDADKILRIEGQRVYADEIIFLLKNIGYAVALLED